MGTNGLANSKAFTDQAIAVFRSIADIRTRAEYGLARLREGDLASSRSVAKLCIDGVATVATAGNSLMDKIKASSEMMEAIAVAVERGDVERPAVIPIGKATSHDVAAPLAIQVALNFSCQLDDKTGFFLGEFPEPFGELGDWIESQDSLAVEAVFHALTDAINLTGYSNEQLELLAGITRREGIAWQVAVAEDFAEKNGNGDGRDYEIGQLVYELRTVDPPTIWPNVKQAVADADYGTWSYKTLRERMKVYCYEIDKPVPEGRSGRPSSGQK